MLITLATTLNQILDHMSGWNFIALVLAFHIFFFEYETVI